MNFLKSIFSDEDGTGSWSRVCSFLALIIPMAWVTHVVVHTHSIPDNLGTVATFITAGNGPYLVNKAHNGITAVMGKGTE